MKTLKYSILTIVFILFFGCKDEGFLKEEPNSFLTIDNAFLNEAQFKTGVNQMYRQVRNFYNANDGYRDYVILGIGTDVLMNNRGDGTDLIYNDWTILNPQSWFPEMWYRENYYILKNANELLVQTDSELAEWSSNEQKLAIQGEIRFFRAFAHRNLAQLFGAVPIIKKPTLAPKLDYVRSPRNEVYEFAKEDLEFAAQNLPVSTSEPGRIIRAAADHLLAEVYICLGDENNDNSMYAKAIEAASRVINGTDGNYKLMTGRYGERMDEEGKDIYWDLFRMGNQDYQKGNTESIWAIQFDKFADGGMNTPWWGRPLVERTFWPSYWAANKFGYSSPARDWTGRGVAFIRPTNHMLYSLWNDPNDIRNASHNIRRAYTAPKVIKNGMQTEDDTTYVTNVELANGTPYEVRLHPGDTIRKEWLTTREDTMNRFFPLFFKFGTDKHIDGIPDGGYVRDYYMIRFAETFLLRAEAYLKSGDKDNAAKDINIVRERANAAPVAASDVNIDYILDERARELFGEEFRMLTLCRMGLLYDRTKRFGWPNSSLTVKEHNNLFPIPQSAIDSNLEADLGQNPGY